MKRSMLVVALIATAQSFSPRPTQAAAGLVAPKPFPVTIVDDLGNHVRITHQPKRIISLDPSDTETLFALGLANRVVADGSKSAEGATGFSRSFRFPSEWPSRLGRDYPVRAKQLPHIEGGYGTTPFDLETIEKLQPDLILSLNSDRPTLEKMRSLGLKVIVINAPNIKGIMRDINLIGRATGATVEASRLTASMKRDLASLRARLKSVHTRPRVYYEIDATNPSQPYTAGPGSFVDDAIHLASAKNVADAVRTCSGPTCYPQLSLESLVRYDPQVIVLGDAAFGTTVESVKGRSGWNTIAAVQTGKIFPMNPDLLSRPGPRIVIGIRALARMVHPEAFRR